MVANPSRAPLKSLTVDPKTIETLQATVDTIAEVVASQAPSYRSHIYAPRWPATLKYDPTMQVSAGAGRAVMAETAGEDLDAEGLASRLLSMEPKHLYIFSVKDDRMLPTHGLKITESPVSRGFCSLAAKVCKMQNLKLEMPSHSSRSNFTRQQRPLFLK